MRIRKIIAMTIIGGSALAGIAVPLAAAAAPAAPLASANYVYHS